MYEKTFTNIKNSYKKALRLCHSIGIVKTYPTSKYESIKFYYVFIFLGGQFNLYRLLYLNGSINTNIVFAFELHRVWRLPKDAKIVFERTSLLDKVKCKTL